MTRQGNRIIVVTSIDIKYFLVAVPSTANENNISEYINRVYGRRNAAREYEDILKEFAPAPPKNASYSWQELELKRMNKKLARMITKLCHECYRGTGKIY